MFLFSDFRLTFVKTWDEIRLLLADCNLPITHLGDPRSEEVENVKVMKMGEPGCVVSCKREEEDEEEEEEKPFAEFRCKTETDATESSVPCRDTLQTAVQIKVEKEEEEDQEHGYCMDSFNVTETHQLNLSLMKTDDLVEEDGDDMAACQDEEETPNRDRKEGDEEEEECQNQGNLNAYFFIMSLLF